MAAAFVRCEFDWSRSRDSCDRDLTRFVVANAALSLPIHKSILTFAGKSVLLHSLLIAYQQSNSLVDGDAIFISSHGIATSRAHEALVFATPRPLHFNSNVSEPSPMSNR
jgi:hypothetical protein